MASLNILVTGGAGFIGSNFIHFWAQQHPEDRVVVLDLLTYAGNRDNLCENTEKFLFVEGDIADLVLVEQLLRDEKIDIIVNFAAESHNSLAIIEPYRFFRTNVIGTHTLLEAARRVGLARFHHISTCEVYGDLPFDSDEKFTEESPYRPNTPYNASKAGADHAVRAYFKSYGLPVTISNCCNNYGPYQFPEKIIPLFTARAMENKPLPLYASTVNCREYIHVLDNCRAIERILMDGKIGETYNVGTGVEKSIMQIADKVLEVLGKPESLKMIVSDRPGHDRRYLLNCDKIQRELSWFPQVEFEQGIRDTIRWYQESQAWLQPLLARTIVDESGW